MSETDTARLTTLEGELLEYKREVSIRSLSREVVAFANTQGGKIKIGVENDGTITGVHRITADGLSGMVRHGCDPPLAPKIDREVHNGKEVITVTIEPGQDVPYRAHDEKYYIRVGATARVASLPELIDLIISGPHRGTILLKARMPQLRTQISASMKAGAGLNLALEGIAELTELIANTTDEPARMEVVDIVSELLEISCSNDKMILDILLILVGLTSIDLAGNPRARPPSQELIKRVIETLEQTLFRVTMNPKVTDRVVHVIATLHMVGLGCAWADYADQFRRVLEVMNSHNGRDRKLTNLCRDTANKLVKYAAEKHTNPHIRRGMLLSPFEKRRDFAPVLSLLNSRSSSAR